MKNWVVILILVFSIFLVLGASILFWWFLPSNNATLIPSDLENVGLVMRAPLKYLTPKNGECVVCLTSFNDGESTMRWSPVPSSIEIGSNLIRISPPFVFDCNTILLAKNVPNFSSGKTLKINLAWLQTFQKGTPLRICLSNSEKSHRGQIQRWNRFKDKWEALTKNRGWGVADTNDYFVLPEKCLPKESCDVKIMSYDYDVKKTYITLKLSESYKTLESFKHLELGGIEIELPVFERAEIHCSEKRLVLRPIGRNNVSHVAEIKNNPPKPLEMLKVSEVNATVPNTMHMTFRVVRGGIPYGMWASHCRWKMLNPSWNFIFYSDEDCRAFIQQNYDSQVLKAYDILIPTAYQSDLFRACVLFKHGGAYLDAKLTMSTEDNLSNRIKKCNGPVFVADRIAGMAYNGFMVAPAGHPVLLETIKRIVFLAGNRIQPQTALAFGPSALGFALSKIYNWNLGPQKRFPRGMHMLTRKQSKGQIETVSIWEFSGKNRMWGPKKHFLDHNGKHFCEEQYLGYRDDQKVFGRLPHYFILFKKHYIYRIPMKSTFAKRNALIQIFPTSLLLPRMAKACNEWKKQTNYSQHVFLDSKNLINFVKNQKIFPEASKTISKLAAGGSQVLLGALIYLYIFGGIFVDVSLVPISKQKTEKLLAASKTHLLLSGTQNPDGRIIGAPEGNKVIKSAIQRIQNYVEKGNNKLPSAAFGITDKCNIRTGDQFLKFEKSFIALKHYKGVKEDLKLAGAGEDFDNLITGRITNLRNAINLRNFTWWTI